MKIEQIYKNLGLTNGLQTHMLNVSSLAFYILNNWNGPHVEKNLLLPVLLLHDVGNIVKFDLKRFPEFLQEKSMEYWEEKQRQTIEKYGNDDHEATQKILLELGVNKSIRDYIYAMSYWNIENVITKDDYLLKIALYADLRIGPFGIMSLHERLEDAHQRVAKYKNRPELKEFAYVLEKQISSHLNIDLYSINNSDIEPDKNLLAYSI